VKWRGIGRLAGDHFLNFPVSLYAPRKIKIPISPYQYQLSVNQNQFMPPEKSKSLSVPISSVISKSKSLSVQSDPWCGGRAHRREMDWQQREKIALTRILSINGL